MIIGKRRDVLEKLGGGSIELKGGLWQRFVSRSLHLSLVFH